MPNKDIFSGLFTSWHFEVSAKTFEWFLSSAPFPQNFTSEFWWEEQWLIAVCSIACENSNFQIWHVCIKIYSISFFLFSFFAGMQFIPSLLWLPKFSHHFNIIPHKIRLGGGRVKPSALNMQAVNVLEELHKSCLSEVSKESVYTVTLSII